MEHQLDGLVGPTHNYAGLAVGNLAAAASGGATSNPREAAGQGLRKMAFVRDLGVPQAVFPPQARPRLDVLRALGFRGDEAALLGRAAREAPGLLAAVWSASPMWAANAATVSPAADTADGKLHLTPANLVSNFHRSLEPDATAVALRKALPGAALHPPLPATPAFGDEGAANHTRFHPPGMPGAPGVELFVYGRGADREAPARFPARQTRAASEALARRHGVRHAAFLRQAPEAIDAGVFHNDVIAVGNANVLLHHEDAFAEPLDALVAQCAEAGVALERWEVRREELSVADAVRSYLFNGQLLSTPRGLELVVPEEASAGASAAVLARLEAETSLAAVHRLDVRESMRNGGGPACLRLRVSLGAGDALHPGLLLTAEREAALEAWIARHYRDRLAPADLADPALIREVHEALDALTQLLDLGGDFYAFQRLAAGPPEST
ncbi:MAG: N-succinylarginine dihydrolase [Myxococcota bacterium]